MDGTGVWGFGDEKTVLENLGLISFDVCYVILEGLE